MKLNTKYVVFWDTNRNLFRLKILTPGDQDDVIIDQDTNAKRLRRRIRRSIQAYEAQRKSKRKGD